MARSHGCLAPWWSCAMWLLLLSSYFAEFSSSAMASGDVVYSADADGRRIKLTDSRQPALYTSDFGDCQGDSLINVTRFDAAYYKDNMTILFHLAGTSALVNESLMLYIGVYAYGEARFDMVFNPCGANIFSLCPLNASVPIEANGIIPISQSDVAGIPPLALTIPDFEGQAILRIFSNSTESQIGCYSAAITNGVTFSHPSAVGTILGIFTLLAIFSSIATAMYGTTASDARNHYAHSLSVFVVFAIFHHIFFTGALSVNWPSNLVAFWSNYAWSAGMIHTSGMQNSINQFLGANRANISVVGAAASGVANDGLGGGYSVSQIFKRSAIAIREAFVGQGGTEQLLAKRALRNSTNGFPWYGQPVRPGLPLPGNFSGFAGTVAEENIPVSNAFMTGFLWFLILLLCIIVSVLVAKGVIGSLNKAGVMNTPRLAYFRAHWLSFLSAVLLRTTFIAFFMFIFLSTFQFTLGGGRGVLAIAALIFILFLLGMMGAAAYALYYRLQDGKYAPEADRLNVERKWKYGIIPWYGLVRESTAKEKNEMKAFAGSIPWWNIHFARSSPVEFSVHEDEEYMRRFGWLASRFRRSRWWFFALWLVYEFIRACLFGGAAGHAQVQVFGLLVVEIVAFIGTMFLKPFEGKRLNLLLVYVLGFSKVTTVALASAFDTRFNLGRITTAAIGVVIIVIQALLTVLLLVAIMLGTISSYMSLTRNNDEFNPKKWAAVRTRYFSHIEQAAADRPPPPPAQTPAQTPEGLLTESTEPYFKVGSVRRQPKIEDEDEDKDVGDSAEPKATSSQPGVLASQRHSYSHSVGSQPSVSNLPYGARRHRSSWSCHDLRHSASDPDGGPTSVLTRMGNPCVSDPATRSRAHSLMDHAPIRSMTQVGSPSYNSARPASGKQSHLKSLSSISKIQESSADTSPERRT